MSDSFRDLVALVVGTALLFGIAGWTYRLSPGMDVYSENVGSEPVSAIEAVTVGRER